MILGLFAFPFLIGKVLTCSSLPTGEGDIMFPFLIGKVLTIYMATTILVIEDGKFPFLIGKVLTFSLLRNIGDMR